MIEWTDISDKYSTFFDGKVPDELDSDVNSVLKEVLEFFVSKIAGKGNAASFDRLMYEVNCDTSRILVAATTEEKRESGRIDGCSVRLQSIQDVWYDLSESGVSDQEFTEGIDTKVAELGQSLREILVAEMDRLLQSCSPDGFDYIVFGSDPGRVYLRETFQSP